MPKSGKKKKEKAADFSKAKLKLGKGKQIANNATDTSFKARSVALPKQALHNSRDESTPTTKRNLSLDELLVHMKHYNSAIRKDALAGLRELLSENPMLIEHALVALINRCVSLISDEDAMVRKSLLSFLSWLLPLVPASKLAPHASMLLLFITSALSHIYPEIRVDAVRFIDILLDIVPNAVISGWMDEDAASSEGNKAETSASGASHHGRRVLSGYMALLNLKGRPGEQGPVASSSSLMLSANSKLILLKSLSTFLKASIPLNPGLKHGTTSRPDVPTWFFAGSFGSSAAFDSFVASLRPTRTTSADVSRTCLWLPDITNAPGASFDEDVPGEFDFADLNSIPSGWSLLEVGASPLSVGSRMSGTAPDASADVMAITELTMRVHPALVSTFLDCAPTVFNPSIQQASGSSVAQVQLISAVGQISRTLYGFLLPRLNTTDGMFRHAIELVENLRILLTYMAPYFPFDTEATQKHNPQNEIFLQDLSLVYCELVALLSASRSSLSGAKKDFHERVAKKMDVELERIGDYVIQALQGQLATVSQPLGRPLSASSYASLMPTMWSLMNVTGRDTDSDQLSTISSRILDAILEHAIRTSSGANVKPVATEFVSRIYLTHVDASYRAHRVISPDGPFARRIAEWVLTLPKLLWELGAKDVVFTERILLFMLCVFQRRRTFMTLSDCVELRRRLCPYLSVQHPTKGSVPGPYTKLDHPPLRRLFLDVASISSVEAVQHDLVLDTLSGVIVQTVVGTNEEGYWAALGKTV